MLLHAHFVLAQNDNADAARLRQKEEERVARAVQVCDVREQCLVYAEHRHLDKTLLVIIMSVINSRQEPVLGHL